jgi:hypothetical protein
MMVHVHYEFVLQGRRFKAFYKGVLGLGLIVAHVYYEFALPTKRFRVYGGILGLGLFEREY